MKRSKIHGMFFGILAMGLLLTIPQVQAGDAARKLGRGFSFESDRG